jgi:hypothetical protein
VSSLPLPDPNLPYPADQPRTHRSSRDDVYVAYWTLVRLRDDAQLDAAGDPGARLIDLLDQRIRELEDP